MASLRVLAFDHEGRPVAFDTWLDNLQLYLLSDTKDTVLLFDHVSGAATAPPATADSATRSQWLSRDAAARLAICNHLPVAECAHFGQHRTAQALYDAVVARYSSPATAALGRLLLPYLFPELSVFATVEDLVSHLRASDAHYRAALPAEDHFLSLDPTSLIVDLFEQHLLAAETSAIAVGAAHGTPRPPFFEGCSPSPLAPSYASTAAADVSVAEDVKAASASAKHRISKGKGGKGGGGGSSGGGGGSRSSGGGSSGGGGGSGTGGGSGGSGGGGGGSGGSGGIGGDGTGGGGTGARHVGFGGGQRQQQHRRSETQSPQHLLEWFLRGASGGSCPYVIRTGVRAGQTCEKLHTQHCCFSRLDDAWRAEFGDNVELPRWADLLRSRIAIFDLNFDAILFAIYALSVSAEVDCYQCVPPDPGIAAAALGASESGTLPGTAPAQALHTFTLDSGASRYFFRDSTTLTPLPAHVLVRLAEPSGGPVVACSSTVLQCPAVPSSSLSGLHLPSFSTNLVSTAALQDAMVTTTTPRGSSLYTLATEPPLVAASAQVSASGQVATSCSCRLLSHQTLLWHRIGLVMEVARTSMIYAAAPHFLWPFAVRYAAHQLNLWPRVSLPEISPTLRWTREVGDASVFRVWGSRAFVCDMSVDKLSARAIPCVFLGFVPDTPGWQFYHPTSRRVFPSQDVMFDEPVPFYRLFPYRSAPPPPPPLFLAPGPPPVDPLPPQGPAPSGVSQVDPLSGTVPVQIVVDLGAAPDAASGSAASGGAEPGEAESEGARSGGAEPGGEEPRGAEPASVETGGVEPGGAGSEGVESGGAEPRGAASSGGPAGASPRLSPQQLHEWFVRRARLRSGAPGVGGAGAAGAGSAGITAGAGGTGDTAATGPGGARTRVTGAAGTGGVGGARAADPAELGAGGAGGTGAGGAGAAGAGAVDPGQVLGVPSSTGLTPLLLCPPPDQSQLPLQPASPLPAPSPCTEQSGSLTEHREPVSRPVSPVCTARRVPRLRPPPVPGTYALALRPSSVPVPPPPESSLPEVPDPESDRARAASPTVARVLATIVTDPSFESATASALVAELLDYAAACRLDYATALVAGSASASPPSVGGECALGTDVLEDRQEDFECLATAVPRFAFMLLAPEGDPDAPDISTPRSYAEAITGPYSSQWQAAMDAEMASWKSTGTYVDEVPPPGANIVDGMVKRPPGSPPAFKARYVARGFSQRQGVDYFQTFSPTPKMTTLRVLLHVAAQRDYELHSLDFSTAFLQGSLHKEIWLRRPPGFTESFPAGTQWSLQQPVYGLRQAPREWHNTMRATLAALWFAPATADPSLFLRTGTSLPPFYFLVYVDDLVFATADTEALTLVKSELQKRHTCTDLGKMRSYLGLQITRDRGRHTITLTQSHMVYQVLQRFSFQFSSPQPTPLSTNHSLSAPSSDESVEPSGPYPELVGCLMYMMTCTRTDLAYPLSLLTRYLAPATQRSSQGYTFSLGSGSVSWRSTRSSSVLSSNCEAEIYAGAMVAQELRWLTYLLTDLGEQPRSPPVLYVDNMAMIALCQEHRLEHITKHIALRYFLAHELQQRGQLRLAYVATRAYTADIFTKALPPGDHQRFSNVLGLVPTLPHLLTA
ncbi:unnamed protein product [Closterium sp. NIES-53]